ncbi:putative RNA recognition motif domain, nucleotide-binding alpha-beta plait domain superfamily [Helianthus debilis subsp. tardiflorus]
MDEGRKGILKFFVVNLPERSSSNEIGDCFSVYGEVVGVYVARKRDKVGNRFGFITFAGVKDKKALEVILKTAWMGNFKLRVNVARFVMESGKENMQPVKPNGFPLRANGSSVVNGQFPPSSQVNSNPLGTAYMDSLVGGLKNCSAEEKVLEISDFVKPNVGWIDKSFIVRTADLSTLVKLDKLLSSLEGVKVDFKYVGVTIAKSWFPWMEVWNGQSLPYKRIAWLKITGVPLHLLDNEVYDSVNRMYDKVVHASTLSKVSCDLTYDLVGVLVGEGTTINDSVTLSWKNKRYRVRVSEERGDWVPDCLASKESWEEFLEAEVEVEKEVRDTAGTKEDLDAPVGSSEGAKRGEVPETRVNYPVNINAEAETVWVDPDVCMGDSVDGNHSVLSLQGFVGGGPNVLEEGELTATFNVGGPEVLEEGEILTNFNMESLLNTCMRSLREQVSP